MRLRAIATMLALTVAPHVQAEDNGIRHAVDVALRTEPGASEEAARAGLRGNLTVLIRISAHSHKADYAGEIAVPFESVDLAHGTGFHRIWEDSACHEKRGLPKLWILRLQGSIDAGKDEVTVLAEPRHLGHHLPEDELQTQQKVEITESGTESDRILRAKSLRSGIWVEVRLSSAPCRF